MATRSTNRKKSKATGRPRNPSRLRKRGDDLLIYTEQGHRAVVDYADKALVAGYAWQSRQGTSTTYIYHQERTATGMKAELLHRRIMGAPKGLVVDHIDRDGLNNRRANLRVCTQAENIANKSPARLAGTGYVGVYPTGAHFSARISIDGERRYLGRFKTAEEASAAYLRARGVDQSFYSVAQPVPGSTPEPMPTANNLGQPARIADGIEAVIRSAGRPLLQKEILTHLAAAGIEISCKGDKYAYVSTVLARANRFEKLPDRTFALRCP